MSYKPNLVQKNMNRKFIGKNIENRLSYNTAKY